jgi:hypothetical protein
MSLESFGSMIFIVTLFNSELDSYSFLRRLLLQLRYDTLNIVIV